MDVDSRGTETDSMWSHCLYIYRLFSYSQKKILLTLQHGFKSHVLSIFPSQRPLGCVHLCVQRNKLMVIDMPYKAATDSGHKELHLYTLFNRSIGIHSQYYYMALCVRP